MENKSKCNVETNELVYAVINNIPSNYRSADLRRFFSSFAETGGFDCFHFRHRPELQTQKVQGVKKTLPLLVSSTSTTGREISSGINDKTLCCIVKVTENKFVEFLRTYHQRNWQDKKGNTMSSKCLISRLRISTPSTNDDSDPADHRAPTRRYQTRADRQHIPPDREEFRESDLLKLPELHPPTVMPQGNVGTPTMFFMRLIQQCRLPPSIIKKLQLDFPKSKGKGRYGNVPFDYQSKMVDTMKIDHDEYNVQTDLVTEESNVNDKEQTDMQASIQGLSQDMCVTDTLFSEMEQLHSQSPSQEDTKRDSTGTEVHESTVVVNNERQQPCVNSRTNIESETAQKDDPTDGEKEHVPDYRELRRRKKELKQERQRLMAERIEEKMIEFERAGSESGDDNDTCEEWERHEAMYDDVTNQGRSKDRVFEEEMEVVWEKGGSGLVFYTDAQYWQEQEGDFDEQTTDDLDVDMSAYYEQGSGDPDIRDFLTIRQEQRRRRGVEKTDRFLAGIGKFERHTKGFGRKIMEKQGWKEGSGLGSSVKGIADALDTEGQHPKNRKGLGYHGEKLVWYGLPAAKKRRTGGEGLISTIYDDPAETDPVETLHRRNDTGYLKHRKRIN